jgi:hypothetical protein
MSQEFMQQYLLDAIGSAVPRRGGAYVAGPLATGRRYYELVASGQGHIASSIREENEEKMKSFVASLRSRLAYPVIDPGLIKIRDWSAVEIGDFYLKVIQHFAKEIWFMDEWQYSRGATKEFQFAVANRIDCLDAQGVIISAEGGSELISDVVAHLTQLGIDSSRFVDRVASIRLAISSGRTLR